jgi:hypothetical protein
MLTLLVEPVVVGGAPAFGLAGQIGGGDVRWSCPFRSGQQLIALPLPGAASESLAAQFRLTGAPRRDGNYLLVYSSAAANGPIAAVVDASTLAASTIRCTSA